MTKFFLIAKASLAVLAGLALALLSLCLYDLHKDLAHANQTITEGNRAILEVGLAAENVRKASLAWEQSAGQQSKYVTAASRKTDQDLEELRKFIDATNESINGKLIPEIIVSVQDSDRHLAATADQVSVELVQISATIAELRPAIENAATITANAAKISGDPAILDTMKSLDETAKNAAGTSADAKKAADLALAKFEDSLKPAKLSLRIMEWVVNHVVDGAELVYYLSH